MTWFWWLRNYRREGADWTGQVLRLGAALDASGGRLPVDQDAVCSLMTSLDPVDTFLADPDGGTDHPLHALRMDLRMLHLFLMAEVEPPLDGLDERMHRYVRRIRDHFGSGGPQAARLPGLAWPVTVFLHPAPREDARPVLDSAVANCRAHGGDWETGVVLMFRAHMVVDSPGGMPGIDGDLAELRVLSRRVGDRWLRAQVCSAAGEAAMARGRHEEAKGEYEEALRLAHEVGAHTETPFLLARLAEIAYRAGDRTTALATLDEASATAERYAVADSRAFVLLQRALMALDEKDIDRARDLYDEARDAIGRATPPPQFRVMLLSVDAMVSAAVSGPATALPKLAEALRTAIEARCSDAMKAALADGTADLMSRLGDHPRAARLLAAAARWRDGHPRPMPEGVDAERAEADARAALGDERYTAECAKGSALTPDDVLGELDEALRTLPIATNT